jgi:hypothetical protein
MLVLTFLAYLCSFILYIPKNISLKPTVSIKIHGLNQYRPICNLFETGRSYSTKEEFLSEKNCNREQLTFIVFNKLRKAIAAAQKILFFCHLENGWRKGKFGNVKKYFPILYYLNH